MDQNIQNGLETVIGAGTSYVSFQSGFMFVLGLVITVIGIFFLFVSLYARIKGHRITGTIIGAIHRTRIKTKIRDGEEVQKIKHDRYLVFEYIRPNGKLHKELSSDGMNKSAGYKTGDQIPLLICPHGAYDDVYDANNKMAFIMAAIFLTSGVFLMYPILIAFGNTKMFWLGTVAILAPGLYKLYTFISDNKADQSSRPPVKQFNESEIKPVEDILGNWDKNE